MGSGGSTIHVIQELVSKYSSSVLKQKILLIHCGGYSQRTPQFSALGKIFSHLPIDLQSANGVDTTRKCVKWTILDVKLALLELFCTKMKSGVFLTAPDDIVVYDRIISDDWGGVDHFGEDEIIALGHPSPVSIALNHGVFIPECWPTSSGMCLEKQNNGAACRREKCGISSDPKSASKAID